MSVLSYDVWLSVNEADLDTEMSELGCDQEPDFDRERWVEKRYEDYLKSTEKNEVDIDHLLAMLKNAQSSARIYRQKFIDCDTKNTCKWTSVSAGYKTDCDVETETRVTGDSDMLMIFCPFCGGYINEVSDDRDT